MNEDDIDSVTSKLLQVERELKEAKAEISRLNVEISKGQAYVDVAIAALAGGALPDSLVDIKNRAITAGWTMKDGFPSLPNSNMGPAEWVRQTLRPAAPHFFTQHADADPTQPTATGSRQVPSQPVPTGRANPWSREGWSATEQARVYKTLGPERAKAMAEAVGSSLVALNPT